MTLSEQELLDLAHLAGLALTPEQISNALCAVSQALTLAQPLQDSVDPGVAPLVLPLPDAQLRLRDDSACATATLEARDALMANAPARAQGLFLVPTVLD